MECVNSKINLYRLYVCSPFQYFCKYSSEIDACLSFALVIFFKVYDNGNSLHLPFTLLQNMAFRCLWTVDSVSARTSATMESVVSIDAVVTAIAVATKCACAKMDTGEMSVKR